MNFYKENNQWFVDLPNWEGSKADLQMVLGADTMLDTLSNNSDSVDLELSTIFEGETSDLVLRRINKLPALLGGGANYKSNKADYNIWLCDVTKFVFGNFPKNIYINKIK